MSLRVFKQLLLQKWVQHETKIRFLLVGGLNTLIGLATYPALYFLLSSHGITYLQTLVISQMVCVTFAFLTNKYMVFRTNGGHLKEYGKFFMFHFSYFLLNLAVLPLIVESYGFHPIYVQTGFTFFVILTSYFGYSKVVFVKKI